jgi:hypothetical protein
MKVKSDRHIREADRRRLEETRNSGALTRFFQRATAGYMKALEKNFYKTCLITALAVLGTPMLMESLALGIRPDTYIKLTGSRVSWALGQLGPLKERVLRDCAPMIILAYLLQPGRWSFNDLQSLEFFRIGSGKTHAEFLWLQPAGYQSRSLHKTAG